MEQVIIYTDGGCLGNPGPGGYGAVLMYGDNRKEVSGGYRLTTNNRMEIMAAIRGLESLKLNCAVKVYTDSQYLVNTMMKGWAIRWRKQGWKKNRDENAKNPDLWQVLLDLCSQHSVEFLWVKGHAGNVENERCDELARAAALEGNLPPDPGYRGELHV